MTTAVNSAQEVEFGSSAMTALILSNVCDYELSGPWTAVNLAGSGAIVNGEIPTAFAPLNSLLLTDAAVSGELLAAFSIPQPKLLIADATTSWLNFYADRAATPPYPTLLRSGQASVGSTSLELAGILGQPELTGRTQFSVRLNLWFSPAGTACGIHNQHDFVEVHTQLYGQGRMQKFRDKTESTKYEEHLISVGNTNPAHFCRVHEGEFTYPWHQYYADTDCLWLAVEYHLPTGLPGRSPV